MTRLDSAAGERWTQNYRPTSGKEQTHSGTSLGVRDVPDIEGHALFWQPSRIITVVPREPAPVNPMGIALALIGAASMIVGVFLPRVELQQFFRVSDNTLVQSGGGWVFVALAVCISAAVYAAVRGRRRTYAVVILAVLGIAFATYEGTGERLAFSSLNPAAAAAVDVPTEKARPGSGLYAAVAGSGLAALGGLLLTGIGAGAGTRLVRWARGRPWTASRARADAAACAPSPPREPRSGRSARSLRWSDPEYG